MKRLALIALVALAGCGADGDPIRPERASGTGVSVTITGTAEVGITG